MRFLDYIFQNPDLKGYFVIFKQNDRSIVNVLIEGENQVKKLGDSENP